MWHSLLSDNATSNANYATMPNVHMFHIFQSEIMILRVTLQIWHWPSNANCAVVTSVLPTGNTKRRQFMTATSAIFVGKSANKQTNVANHIDYLVI